MENIILTNREKVIKLRKESPCATTQNIGDKVGLSGERVRQILKLEGLPTKHYHVTYHCAECGTLLPYGNRTGLCKGCRHKITLIPLICDTCGKLFYRPSNIVLHTNQPHTGFYCSHKCYGVKLGNKHGFAKHPENRGRNTVKWDYSIIWNKYTNDKLNGLQISKQLNIPNQTIYKILNTIKSLPTQEAIDNYLKEKERKLNWFQRIIKRRNNNEI